MTDHFSSLPWFLREYVHSRRWGSFRAIQEATFDYFRRGDDHILISAGTSSGKTEAAMFPVITSLYNNPSDTVGALYIGPLKALIDDQFDRMDGILRESGIPVTGWHGDVDRNRKARFLDAPSGILQITPESLQNIVSSDPDIIRDLFSGLRFVIIDEVHTFVDSDRGAQLQCCLHRIEVVAGCDPRRIGLSATLSDTALAANWLSSDTGRRTSVIKDPSASDRSVYVRYRGFPVPDEDGDDTERKRAITGFYRNLLEEVRGGKCIVFVNSRYDAEVIGRSLRKIAERTMGNGDWIHVHHGSVSHEFRRRAEEDLKDPSKQVTVVSTVTLELGIDIGELDRIVQVDAPFTCTGMVQRMGRSGRRGGGQRMVVFCREDSSEPWSSVDGVSMDLVKAIAMTELIMNEGWTEPPVDRRYPFGLLYHQTMEFLKESTGARFGTLSSEVLSMKPFSEIDKDAYKKLLRHMVSSGQLVRMEDGTLLIGPKGEKVAFGHDFCSVFKVKKEIDVISPDGRVGSIQGVPDEGELIQLAGRIWQVIEVRSEDATVLVEETDGSAETPWKSGTPDVHPRVMSKMRDVLGSDTEYPYLDPAASNRLALCRTFARNNGMLSTFSEIEGGIRLFPWVGTIQFDTLVRALRMVNGVDRVYGFRPYYIDVLTRLPWDDVLERVNTILSHGPSALVSPDDIVRIGKYDQHVPKDLLELMFADERLDTNFRLE
ncbi:MAG: DEAD/DEAH box helicase [Candidatus Methanomethylophilaceae archaeon]|nr:DEAD/DEAH box helicase [Candidatus Methanomethylophilaceae archaeon]